MLAGSTWTNSSVHQEIPANAFKAGSDEDGCPIFVGKVKYRGDELVAKLIPAKQQAFVTFSGLEVFVPEYKVLTGNEFEWVNCSEGKFPPKAVTSGKTSTGENLYVGRTTFEGNKIPGKIHPSHSCIYISYNGCEIAFRDYEALVDKSSTLLTKHFSPKKSRQE